MAHKDQNHLVEDLHRLIDYHDKSIEDIDNVIIDHSLIKNDWKIYFAIDYHHVHEFAFRFSKLLKHYATRKSLSPQLRSRFVQHQAALSFLFYGFKDCEPPIILPPHIIELRNQIALILSKAIEVDLQIKSFRALSKELLSKEEGDTARQAYTIIMEGKEIEKLPTNLYDKLVQLSLKKYYDILFLITGVFVEPLEVIDDLTNGSSPRLQLASELVHEHSDLIMEIITGPNSEYYDIFSRLRWGKRDENYRDAKLIDIILGLNNKFFNNNEKRIIYLLSDAECMDIIFHNKRYPDREDIFKDYPNIDQNFQFLDPWGRPNCIHRRTDIFLTYMIAADENIEKTVANLYERRSALWSFGPIDKMIEDVKKSCIKDCNNCDQPLRTNCKQIRKLIREKKEKYTEIVYLTLLSNRFSYLERYFNIKSEERIKSIGEGIKALLLFLNDKNEALETLINNRREEADSIYRQIQLKLKENIIQIADDSIQDLLFYLKPFWKIPFQIRFQNMAIRNKLAQITEYLNTAGRYLDIERIRVYSSELLNITENPEIGDERYLLLALLLYNYNLFEKAENIISELVIQPDSSILEESFLIWCLALHQIAIENKNAQNYERSLEQCNRAMEKYPRDPRFDYLTGLIKQRGIYYGVGIQYSIEDVISHYNTALKKNLIESSEGLMFKATIWNNIAHAYILSQQETTVENLYNAEKAMDTLETILSEDKWRANFLDTKAMIIYYFAIKTKAGSKLIDDLEISKHYLSSAIALAKQQHYPRFQVRSYNSNIRMVSKKLRECRQIKANK